MSTLLIYASTLTTLLLAFILTFVLPPRTYFAPPPVPLTSNHTTSWSILHHLGGNGPWIPHTTSALTTDLHPPPNCRIDQIHLLSRHAARYPTRPSGIRMLQLYHRLAHLNHTFTGPLSFINTYNFFMPDPAARLENLVPVGPYAGTLQAFQTGTEMRTRYEELVLEAERRGQMTFWASGSRRVEETARYWAAGMWGLDWEYRARLEVVSEGTERGADTLTPGRTCKRYREEDGGRIKGYKALEEWMGMYLPRVGERLKGFEPEVHFTNVELFTMQEMCGFEILAKGSSPWCDVFTREEWDEFEYARDLLHYYRAGEGNIFGATMGWLFLNATKDLLVQGPDAGLMFASFVHDGDLVPFLNALDLFPQLRKLSTDHVMSNRTWRTSDVTPMGGRIILERLACPAPQNCWSNEPYYPNHVYCDPVKDDYFIRVNVNDGIVAMSECQEGPGGSCPLDRFVQHVKMRGRHNDDFRAVCALSEDAPDRITFLNQPPRKDES
ncbi:acid phosphatase-like protein 2 [Elsinoe australis]|uniref:Acid phosphatase-like protein 2 n=1 Tax=Elsinoe australis TaxID=40998 RepID=A0A4U7ALG7_9PEZI|nr:acid phosphatase-like protein 2 [Elsinoe australis]